MPFKVEGDLAAEKASYLEMIDRQAGIMRSNFITTVAGQEMVYMQKRSEAELIVADPDMGDNVSEAETPHVTAEAADDGVSRFEKAVEILTIAQMWATVSPEIERRRLKAKTEVEAATTVYEARRASVLDWSSLQALLG